MDSMHADIPGASHIFSFVVNKQQFMGRKSGSAHNRIIHSSRRLTAFDTKRKNDRFKFQKKIVALEAMLTMDRVVVRKEEEAVFFFQLRQKCNYFFIDPKHIFESGLKGILRYVEMQVINNFTTEGITCIAAFIKMVPASCDKKICGNQPA